MTELPGVYDQLKQKLRMRLAEQLERRTRNGQPTVIDRETIVSNLRLVWKGLLADSQRLGVSADEQEQLLGEVASEVIGIGPLEPLLADPDITEIMVNGPNQVYVERHGRLELTPIIFRDTTQLMMVIERILDRAGTSVTGSDPCIDASLPDGSRVNVIIPPLVLNGPTVTIRKKLRQWDMDEFVSVHTLSPQAAQFLSACVKARVNFVVSGGSSTAKTTLVSVLSAFIPPQERIISIEKVAELELAHREHWIRLVSRSGNVEGRGEVPLRSLVRNALSMRPDRIILGEARGGEALDVVQAMHTGHEGVITVLHANSPQAAFERLSTLMLMSGLDIPPQACEAQLASAIDLIVHLARFSDGTRRIASIAQVQVMSNAGGGFQMEELFTFDVQGFRPDGTLEGELRYSGVRPKFLHKFQINNVEVPAWLKT